MTSLVAGVLRLRKCEWASCCDEKDDNVMLWGPRLTLGMCRYGAQLREVGVAPCRRFIICNYFVILTVRFSMINNK